MTTKTNTKTNTKTETETETRETETNTETNTRETKKAAIAAKAKATRAAKAKAKAKAKREADAAKDNTTAGKNKDELAFLWGQKNKDLFQGKNKDELAFLWGQKNPKADWNEAPKTIDVFRQVLTALAIAEHEKATGGDALQRFGKRALKGTGADGRKTLDNGDAVSSWLRTLDLPAITLACDRAKGWEEGATRAKYATSNPGQRRMTAGNLIRGCIKRGETTLEALQS